MSQEIQIRFNTDKERVNEQLPAWRVLVDGVEKLAREIRVEVPMWTSQDQLPDGRIKWHLSCRGYAVWDEADGLCHILQAPDSTPTRSN